MPKYVLDQKMFGVFEHRIERHGDLLAGFGEAVSIPSLAILKFTGKICLISPDLRVLADSDGSGLGLLEDTRLRHFYMFNHFEYDPDTLKREYDRDVGVGQPIHIPANYYPDDDPERSPVSDWQADGKRLYQNWLGLIAKNKG